jgi:hypothetical protein
VHNGFVVIFRIQVDLSIKKPDGCLFFVDHANVEQYREQIISFQGKNEKREFF